MFSIARPQQTTTVHTAAAATDAQKVIAERYKTKLCRNWVATGVCPYDSRCMFAHDEHELRTTEMNLRDGLVTDEAIRNFKKMMQLKEHARAIARDNNNGLLTTTTVPSSHARVFTTQPQRRLVVSGSPIVLPHAQQQQPHHHAVAYTHDPYGWMFNPECGCEECLPYHSAALRTMTKYPTTNVTTASASDDLELVDWGESSSMGKKSCEPAGSVESVAMP